uniref:Uncharacterized protein n=1 Tax=Arundo donax TaxID=35708 RepID=A0A0A9CCT0_ARUDO
MFLFLERNTRNIIPEEPSIVLFTVLLLIFH